MTRRALLALSLAILARQASAQTIVSARHPLPARLALTTRDTLERLIDSALVAGFSTDPLVAKVAEGSLKGADDARIIRAVRSLVRELGEARAVLPPGADESNLAAAASALHAGVPASTLRRLVAAGQGAGAASLSVALVTVADLAASQVPAEAAAASVELLLRRRAPESEMMAFRFAVARDIEAGRAPDAALAARAQATLRTLDDRPAPLRKAPPR